MCYLGSWHSKDSWLPTHYYTHCNYNIINQQPYELSCLLAIPPKCPEESWEQIGRAHV